MLTNNRQISITAGASRKATVWRAQVMYLSELYERLRVPSRSEETLAAYLALKKPEQDERKDVGGFVAGTLNGPRRKADAVLGRDLITLDLDSIPAGGTEDVLRRLEGLGCGFGVYSTRKHCPAAPRLRVLLPLNRAATADEYEPCARRMAAYVGMELADPTTFEASRLMYWPSCCSDSEYIYAVSDKPFLSVDGLLATYQDWRNVSSWPQVPGTAQVQQKLAARQGDPTGKPGVVGAFCRVYDVYRAISELLQGIYEPSDIPDRYTYTGGSTAGGAVVYEQGKFLYSHHATDPAGGKLSNAFDLVRLHKFAALDDEAKPDTPANKLPSFVAMCELALTNPEVSVVLSQERRDAAVADFEGVAAGTEDSPNWMLKLKRNHSSGAYEKSADNVLLILENDPLLKGRIALDEFANKGIAIGKLPWDVREFPRRTWTDNDDAGTRWYMEKVYNITGEKKVTDALSLCGRNHAFDDVREYLKSLSWDGVVRLDTLFIDYLGAEDTAYMRAVTRKAFTAAVARVMEPGIKFDVMTVLTGRQGIGKSTLLRYMGRNWFTDSVRTFEGKEAAELIQGTWIVEISELQAFKGADVDRIKQVLSQCVDRFRAAYGRHVQDCPRRCIFFGSSNNREYLRDKTGNRRFWPVDTGIGEPTKNVFRDLPSEVSQLWAEAVVRWQLGESLYLGQTLEAEAERIRETHRETSPREGLIRAFLEREVPEDWSRWTLDQRKTYWGGGVQQAVATVPRDKVCAIEIWCECFNADAKFMKNTDAREINDIMEMFSEWERFDKSARFGPYGVQKGFRRCNLSK